MAKHSPNAACPCGAGNKYKRCCGAYHAGAPAPTPETLMRSRFCAYALGLVDYIIDTTDPEGSAWEPDRAQWAAEVVRFCTSTRFEGLEIRSSHASGDRGEVTFHAQLRRGADDVSFAERSTFVRVAGRWLYHAGEAA